ncbi:glycosyltransferase family 4 protein [Novosphingobium sp. Fuku2-ISO-50]|uniref:glycosyltransferase family 4 protein n=1 Tax=Novosphingobium sp. Fuku2-ISO-50 TaxID=1739114 RepID=UPI0009E95693|nr:glycosyltransferase family 4 protein [Novosphingobium sp. Fuku2-ISO-50]
MTVIPPPLSLTTPPLPRSSATRQPIDRIVVINDLSHPMGGASALAVQSALGFAHIGYPVTFLSGDAPPPKGMGHRAIETIGLGQGRLLDRGARDALITGWWNRAALAMVRHFIATRDTPGTVYHLHGWSQILSPAIFAALAPVRDRLVISAHDFFLVCPTGAYADLSSGAPCTRVPLSAACCLAGCDRRSRMHKIWRLVRATIQRAMLDPQNSPPILAIHAAMTPGLQRGGIPAQAIRVVPNPVVPWSATRIHAEGNRDVLFVGRLEQPKGPDLALAAARAAGVSIQVVGDGAMAAQLRSEYPEGKFAGKLDPAAIAVLASQARLLVMPSRAPEPYGLVAMEAVRGGLPVVLPPSALLSADIARIGAGVAVEPRDTPAFAALLRRLAKDDCAIRAMSEAAFAHGAPLALDPDDWLDRLLGLYRERLGDVASSRACPSMSACAGGT